MLTFIYHLLYSHDPHTPSVTFGNVFFKIFWLPSLIQRYCNGCWSLIGYFVKNRWQILMMLTIIFWFDIAALDFVDAIYNLSCDVAKFHWQDGVISVVSWLWKKMIVLLLAQKLFLCYPCNVACWKIGSRNAYYFLLFMFYFANSYRAHLIGVLMILNCLSFMLEDR